MKDQSHTGHTVLIDPSEHREFVQFLSENSYFNIRRLDCGIYVANIELFTTRAICINIDWHCWQDRYCYQDRELASQAVRAYQDPSLPPLPGYVAERHIGIGPLYLLSPQYREVQALSRGR